MHVQFSGRYRLQVFHGDTDILLQDTGWFDNLITNNGLDLMGTMLFSTAVCYVGSDTADPAVTDTSIANVLASASPATNGGGGVYTAASPYYGWRRHTFTFAIGAIQGTIGQVAIGKTASDLFSKARLTGINGTPTTLALSGIDRLTLTYELRQYIRETDATYSIDINGSSYSCRTRARNIDDGGAYWSPYLTLGIGNGNSSLGAVAVYTGGSAPFVGSLTGAPSGTEVSCSSFTRGTYVPGTYRLGMTATWTTATGALTNITAAHFGRFTGGDYNMGGSWQSSIEGATLSKTQYQNLTLDWEYSWGRYA